MSNVIPVIQQIEKAQLRKTSLGMEFRVGDTVKVHTVIKEGDKERVQVYEGVVIARKAGGIRAAFTVRKISYGVGVERTFPEHSSRIEKVEVIARGRVRRAKLFYLRDLKGKAARLRADTSRNEAAAEAAAEEKAGS